MLLRLWNIVVSHAIADNKVRKYVIENNILKGSNVTIMQKNYWFMTSAGNLSALLLLNQSTSLLNLLFFVFTLTYSLIDYYDLNYSKYNIATAIETQIK